MLDEKDKKVAKLKSTILLNKISNALINTTIKRAIRRKRSQTRERNPGDTKNVKYYFSWLNTGTKGTGIVILTTTI